MMPRLPFRFVSLLIVGAATPLAAQAPLTPHQQLAREVYKQLVEINTVDSVGNVTTAAEAMAARFRTAGFTGSDVQVLVPADKPTKGNLVVRLHGRAGSTLKPILLLAHIDVVAANRADWPRDPFTLHEEGKFFLGRGTTDDKAMASMFVANVLRMKREGVIPDRDIILALTADEEGGDANGVDYLVKNHRALIDAAYALNEGGGGTLEGDKPIYHSVQAAEKVYLDFMLTATNTGGHSSVPRPDNAIYELGDALHNLAHYRFPVALNPISRAFFAQTALVEPRADYAAAMRAIVANDRDSVAAATLSHDARFASILRTTCVATRLAGGHANNALPQRATANVNCRIVPTSSRDEVVATLDRVIADTGIKVTDAIPLLEKFGAKPTPVEPTLLTAITTLTKRMWGDIPVIPAMGTGATDGRILRAAGIPTYGVSGIFSAPGENNSHGRDEKLRVKSFFDGLTFLDELVRMGAVSPRM